MSNIKIHNREAVERINYLYQASHLVIATATAPAATTTPPVTPSRANNTKNNNKPNQSNANTKKGRRKHTGFWKRHKNWLNQKTSSLTQTENNNDNDNKNDHKTNEDLEAKHTADDKDEDKEGDDGNDDDDDGVSSQSLMQTPQMQVASRLARHYTRTAKGITKRLVMRLYVIMEMDKLVKEEL